MRPLTTFFLSVMDVEWTRRSCLKSAMNASAKPIRAASAADDSSQEGQSLASPRYESESRDTKMRLQPTPIPHCVLISTAFSHASLLGLSFSNCIPHIQIGAQRCRLKVCHPCPQHLRPEMGVDDNATSRIALVSARFSNICKVGHGSSACD